LRAIESTELAPPQLVAASNPSKPVSPPRSLPLSQSHLNSAVVNPPQNESLPTVESRLTSAIEFQAIDSEQMAVSSPPNNPCSCINTPPPDSPSSQTPPFQTPPGVSQAGSPRDSLRDELFDSTSPTTEAPIMNQHEGRSTSPTTDTTMNQQEGQDPISPTEDVQLEDIQEDLQEDRESNQKSSSQKAPKSVAFIQDAKQRRDHFYVTRKRMVKNLYLLGQRTNCYGYLYLRRLSFFFCC